jgi:hypothetical protein
VFERVRDLRREARRTVVTLTGFVAKLAAAGEERTFITVRVVGVGSGRGEAAQSAASRNWLR